jgi:hypothetical protein
MCETGHFHSLFIGISDYDASLGRATFATDDSKSIAQIVAVRTGSTPELLVDGEAADRIPTGRRVQMQLAGLIAQATGKDTLLVYFAGLVVEVSGKPYLAMSDSALQNLHHTGLSLAKLCDSIEQSEAGQRILILDAWRRVPSRPTAPLTQSTIHELELAERIYGITSCDEGQHALDWKEKKQGVFAWYFIEALSGKRESKQDREQTLSDIFDRTREQVVNWTAAKNKAQVPRQFLKGSSAPVLPEMGTPGTGFVECPSCGRHNAVKQTFECLLCGR